MKFATIVAISIAANAMAAMAQNVPPPDISNGAVQTPAIPDVQAPTAPDDDIAIPPTPPTPPEPPMLKLDPNATAHMSPQELRKLNKELKTRMEMLSRQLKMKVKEFNGLKNIQLDSSGLANQLKVIRVSLDSAKYSLRTLDSSIRFFDNGSGFGMMIMGDSMPNCSHNCAIIIRRDSTLDPDGNGMMMRNMVIVRSGDSAGGTMTQTTTTMFGTDADAPDVDDLASGALINSDGRSMMIVNRDTTFIDNDGKHQNRIIRIMTDSSDGKASVIINRSGNGDEESTYNTVTVLSGNAAKAKLQGSNTVLASGKTNVVIISSSKGRRVQTTRDAAPAAEKRSAQQAAANAGYALEKAIPNPTHDVASISYTLAKPGRTSLTLFDQTGKVVKVVRDEMMSPGTYTDQVNVGDLPSGLYLYQLVSGEYSQSNTLTVTK